MSDDFLLQMPDDALKKARGMQHYFVHGYDGIDLDIVWMTAREKIPSLCQLLEQYLARCE